MKINKSFEIQHKLVLLLLWLCVSWVQALPAVPVQLRIQLNCQERAYISRKTLHNNYWLLENYIKAAHGQLHCISSVTYTTHADYRYLDNLLPLLERWQAPISVALYAPGEDFQKTLDSIKWLRQCAARRQLVREYVSFHIYFDKEHLPSTVPKSQHALQPQLACNKPAPFLNVTSRRLYRKQKQLLYPINVGRNVARNAALTHFVLASDIELYPTPHLVERFFGMLASQKYLLHRKHPFVFPLRIFEVAQNVSLPQTKQQLQQLLASSRAIPFHQHFCPECHEGPHLQAWIKHNDDTHALSVFQVARRTDALASWEPIFIGTQQDPPYDERLSWEGMGDKLTQCYALCALGYEFHILDNAFLVHKPGIKSSKLSMKRRRLARKTNFILRYKTLAELRGIYGFRRGCYI